MKKKNQGFSLVELIVTIAILAIVVAPLLNAFVISSKTNAKARERLRTTTIAQNIMEGVEKLTLEELAFQFDYPDSRFNIISSSSLSEVEVGVDGDNNPIYGLPVSELISTGTRFQKVQRYEDVSDGEVANWEDLVSSSIISKIGPDGSKVYEFVGQSSRNYYFLIQNISSGIGGKQYSALISVTPNDNVRSSEKSANEVDMAELQRIDVTTDGVAYDRITPNDALGFFPIEEVEGPESSETESEESSEEESEESEPAYDLITETDINRSIEINVRKDNGATIAEIIYIYSAKDHNNVELKYEQKDLVFDNSENKSNELKNLYLMYFPWYSHNNVINPEKITINNKDNIDFTLHLIKQKNTKWTLYYPSKSLHDLENEYCVALYMEEGSKKADGHSYCDLQTNLNQDMANNLNKETQIQEAYYNGTSPLNVLTDVMQMRGITTPAKSWDRMFDVTVNVYDNAVSLDTLSVAEPISTFTGGMTN